MPPDSIVQGKTRGVEAGVADIGYGYKQNTTFKEVATSNSNSLKLVTEKPLVRAESTLRREQKKPLTIEQAQSGKYKEISTTSQETSLGFVVWVLCGSTQPTKATTTKAAPLLPIAPGVF